MKDLIDERNEREKISRSIIKYWNVNYVPKQPEESSEPEENEKKAEPAEAAAEDLVVSAEDFNRTTGSYSGAYGKKEVKDEVTKGQIDKILHEKSENLRHVIDESMEKE